MANEQEGKAKRTWIVRVGRSRRIEEEALVSVMADTEAEARSRAQLLFDNACISEVSWVPVNQESCFCGARVMGVCEPSAFMPLA